LGKGVVQIGPGICTSIKDIPETTVEISQKDINIKYETSKPESDKARSADFLKATAVLGWYLKTNLTEGLRKQYQWISK